MGTQVTYYVSAVSPYNYLGAERFRKIAEERNLEIEMKIMDLGKVFPKTGGLPLPQRAPERLAYRIQELKRFSVFHHIPLTLQPTHFPPSSPLGGQVVACARRQDTHTALRALEAVLKMTWADEQDTGDAAQLIAALNHVGLDGQTLVSAAQKDAEALQAEIDADSADAVEAGIFGAPSFVVGSEMFWGQDRIDLLCWHLDNNL